MKIDGNIYTIQFRLHDNRYPNSPKAIYRDGGIFRSDALALGEPTFDPVRRMFCIGIGGPKGLSLMAANTDGELRADLVKLRNFRGDILDHASVKSQDVDRLSVGYNRVNVSPAITLRNGSTAVAKFGYGHGLAGMALLYNIRDALLKAVSHTLTNAIVNNLYLPPSGLVMTTLSPDFRSVYGVPANLFAHSEVFTGDTLSAATVTSNIAISPDGTKNASYIVGTTNSATPGVGWIKRSCAIQSNTKYCTSVFVKPGSAPTTGIELSFDGGVGTVYKSTVWIDWATKAVTVSNPASSWQGGVIKDASGYYRLWLTGYSDAHTTLNMKMYVRDMFSTTHVIGENTIIWGAMANKGHVPQYYIKTT